MHIPVDSDSVAAPSSDSFMEYFARFAIDLAPSSSFSLVAGPASSVQPFDESIFRFVVNISVLVTVCDDERLMSAAGGMSFFMVSTADAAAAIVVILLSHTVDDLAITNGPCEFDSLDNCDKLDTVNAETVDAVLSILLNTLPSVSKMNGEFRDVG